jgi:hypothetical protein
MTPIQDVRPLEYSWRSGWRLMQRPQGRAVTVTPPPQHALPLAFVIQPAPALPWWEQVRQWLCKEILFPPRTPY